MGHRAGRALAALIGLAAAFAGAVAGGAATAAEPLRIDYAYYNPVGLVLKAKGWLEEDLAADGVAVTWVLSQGSNKALEFLNGESLDIGSTAAAASFIGRANGNPIRVVYAYSRPEWTALVARAGSGITGIEALKGRKVAVTRGTDPFIFLLRALGTAGLGERDIRLVPLQHGDGRLALDRGDVEAWAGLDPFMAQAEIEGGHDLFYRNRDFVSAGVLNVRETFASAHPGTVQKVIAAYEKARRHALDHPEELRATLAAAARLTPEIAARQLERTDITRPALGEGDLATIVAAGEVLKASGIVPAGTDVPAVAGGLIDSRYAQSLVGG